MKSDLLETLSIQSRAYMEGRINREEFLSSIAFHINTYPLDDDDVAALAQLLRGHE